MAYGPVFSVHERNSGSFENDSYLNFKRRIESHLQFAGIIRSSPYSTSFYDKD